MALIPCIECNRKISDKAIACPSCGVPITGVQSAALESKPHVKVTRTGARWEGAGFVLILTGMVLTFAMNAVVGGMLILVGFIVFIIGRFL